MDLNQDWTITVDLDPWRIAAGLALVVWALWFYRHTLPPVSAARRALLAAMRVCGFLLLVTFAIDPSVVRREETERSPVIAVLLDVSASMGIEDAPGSGRYETAVAAVRDISGSAGETRIDILPFASGLIGHEEGTDSIPEAIYEGTDIFGVLDEADRRYAAENLAAFVLVSDGRVTRGMGSSRSSVRVPVYAVAVGDSSSASDLSVERIEYERKVYTGTRERIRAVIRHTAAKGESASVVLRDGERALASSTAGPLTGNGLASVELEYTPEREGTRSMEVMIAPLENEAVEENNMERFRVTVLKDRLDILYFDAAPDWNMTFLRRLCGASKRLRMDAVVPAPGGKYRVSGGGSAEFPPSSGTLSRYDLVIIGHGGDFPSSSGAATISEYLDSGGAVLYIGSEGSPLLSMRSVTLLRSSLPVRSAGAPRLDAAEYHIHRGPAVDAAYLPDIAATGALPPLTGAITGLVPSAGARVPLVMRFDGMEIPFLVLEQKSEGMTAVMLGFPVWRWRLAGESGADAWAGLMGGLVQYLAEGRDSPLLDVQTDRTSYRTGEKIRISVYPSTRRAGEDARGEILAGGRDGTLLETFIPVPSGDGSGMLETVTGGLPPGEYTARVSSGNGKAGGAEGTASFSVEPLSVELLRTAADMELLGRVASSSGGALVGPGEAGKLRNMIDPRSDTVVTASARKLRESAWLFIAIVAVFAAEWLIRKLLGLV